jgi:polyhydroxyalkanoate synthesis regulator phasin
LLLTTHAAADPDFQEQVLKLAAPYVRSGEVRADQVATLTDDLLRARGKKQRYGTQFEFHDGELRPAPIEDEANVDARRREVGLLSLANEVCLTRALFSAPARQ